MDSDVIQKLLAKKKTLDKNDEGQHLTFVRDQVYGGNWDAYYAAGHYHLVDFGANAGTNEVPDEELEPKKYFTYLENMVTTLSTLGSTTAPKTSLKRNTNSIIRALQNLFGGLSTRSKIKFYVCYICINS
jgi:hypothetical protein